METLKIKHIHIITSDEGDWIRLMVNGKMYDEGHSIHRSTWLELLQQATDCKVSGEERTVEWFEKN